MAGKEEEDLKLLGRLVSPFVVRVRIALGIKGLSYEYVEEDLHNKSELLLRLNPVHRKVPVLIHNGKPLCESLVIVQYVDETFAGRGRPILPADPYKRATARFWAAFVDDKLCPAIIGIVKQAKTEEERAAKAEEALAAVEHLEEALSSKCSDDGGSTAFFGGHSVGYVDIALGSWLFWLEALHRMFGLKIIDASRSPLLAAWAERFADSVEAKELLPEADVAVQYAKKLQAAAAAK